MNQIPGGLLENAYRSTLSLKGMLEMMMDIQSGNAEAPLDAKVLAELEEARKRTVGFLAEVCFSPPVPAVADA